MDYYIGIDGGGSKTIFCLLGNQGTILQVIKGGSASYKQVGIQGVMNLLKSGLQEVTSGITENATYHTCFGMPNYGESLGMDKEIRQLLKAQFPEFHIHIVNDSEVGWAASLLLKPGINIVAGTGSIAYGKNEVGEWATAGGWSQWFSDEGSGHWLGKKCMELFAKEADGRKPKGELYQIVRAFFGIKQDIELIDIVEKDYFPYRDMTASLQRLLYKAAVSGDFTAVQAYAEAAMELAEIVRAVKERIFPNQNCIISYSGGIFKTGDIVLKPFAVKVSECGAVLKEPEREPYVGAGILAYYYRNKQIPSKEFLNNTNMLKEKQEAKTCI